MAATLQGLIDFINAQPATRPVNHDSWNQCAVGEYAREVCGSDIPLVTRGTVIASSYEEMRKSNVLRSLWQDAGSFCMFVASENGCKLTDEKTLMDILNEDYDIGNTYGDLQNMIAAMRASLIA